MAASALAGAAAALKPVLDEMSVVRVSSAVVVTAVLSWVVSWRLYAVRVSKKHSLYTGFLHFLSNCMLRVAGYFVRSSFEKDLKKPAKANEETLLDILKRAANTQYGQEYKFASIKSEAEWKQLHPLTSHSHYTKYLEEIANEGKQNVLTGEPVVRIALTSGTSGAMKAIPVTSRYLKSFFLYVTCVFNRMYELFPQTFNLQRDLRIIYTPNPRQTVAGLPMRPNSNTPKDSAILLSMHPSPLPAFSLKDEREALYAHALFGLLERDLGSIQANFAPMVLALFNLIVRHGPLLISDIANGTYSGQIAAKLDASVSQQGASSRAAAGAKPAPAPLKIVGATLGAPVPNPDAADEAQEGFRAELKKALTKDPKRAEEVRQALGHVEGLARRLWPHLAAVITVDGGSFELAGVAMRKFLGPDVPVCCPLYASTEGMIGLNMDLKSKDRFYTLVPRAMGFEFIREDDIPKSQPETLNIEEIKEGETYEIAITNLSGLYRYRMGDVIKVVGFHDKTPVVQFRYRAGMLLSLRGEKLTEPALVESVAACVPSSVTVREVCFSDMGALHMEQGGVAAVIAFVEATPAPSSYAEALEWEARFDAELGSRCPDFQYYREKGSISKSRLVFVPVGTFEDLKRISVQRGASALQVKVPRLVKEEFMGTFLLQRAISFKEE